MGWSEYVSTVFILICSSLQNISLEAAARSLKNIEIHLGAATHLLKNKKYQLHIFFQK